MRKAVERKLNFTIVFCEDEEENQAAFEHAVKALVLSEEEERPLTDTNE